MISSKVGNPILKTLTQSFLDQNLLLLCVGNPGAGVVFGPWCLKQNISIISHGEARHFYKVCWTRWGDSVARIRKSCFILKGGLYDESAEPRCNSIALKKHPTQTPVPTLSRKERSSSFCCSTRAWNPEVSWRIAQFQQAVKCPLPWMLLENHSNVGEKPIQFSWL